jgi:murein L,D-transpeptidase YafK
MKRLYIFSIILATAILAFAFQAQLRRHTASAIRTIQGKKTVSQQVNEYGHKVKERLLPDFQAVGIPYPPAKIILVCIKHEKKLEVWACGSDGKFKLTRTYPILAASGRLGPKLKEGDYQVPEGLYRIESLNPNSKFHLSLKLNYPNDFDLACAKRDGRRNLGGDIMIHGSNVSIGCLAMGDEAAEDLFVLAAQTGLDNICVILSPIDFRMAETPKLPHPLPPWTETLYEQIKQELLNLATNRKATSPMAPAKGL